MDNFLSSRFAGRIFFYMVREPNIQPWKTFDVMNNVIHTYPYLHLTFRHLGLSETASELR